MCKKLVFLITLVLLLNPVGSVSAALVAYYDFETGSGDIAYDESGYGTTADGTIYGDTAWTDVSGSGVASLGNYALYFDDDDDVVKCGDPAKVKNITGAITVAAWVKIDHFTRQWQTVVSKYTSWWLRRGYSYKPYPDWWVGTDTSSTTTHAENIQDSTWHHLAGTYDSATGEMYVYTDGLLSDSAALTGSIYYDIRELWIGADGTGDNVLNEWKGLIDEVRIYDEALSASEIAELAGFENTPPVVDAGGNRSIVWPDDTVSLDATVSDDGRPNPPGAVTLTWSKVSGPCDVTFDPNEFVEDPDVTFSGLGTYVLHLTADDNELDANDEVTIVVYEEAHIGLVAYYDFETGSGTTDYDQASNPVDGTIIGEASWLDVSGTGIAALGNYALDLDGTDDYVKYGSVAKFDITDAITFALWVKVDSWTKWTTIAGRYHPWFIRKGQSGNLHSANWRTDGTAEGGTAGISFAGATNIDDGQWHHIVGTYDGATGKQYIYIDSVLENSGQGDVGGQISYFQTTDFAIGAAVMGSNPVQYLDGQIDDVRLYDSALSADHINDIFLGIDNLPPKVEVGLNQTITWPVDTVSLDATVSDDGRPDPPGAVILTWSKVSGPGSVSFTPNANVADPTATFSKAGIYVLRLIADDNDFMSSDEVKISVRVEGPCGEGLVVYYDFETGGGSTLYDQSGYGMPDDGIIAGDPEWLDVSGTGITTLGNYALDFDGDGDFVNCDDPEKFDITDAITVAAWVEVTIWDKSWQTIADRYHSWSFRRDTATGNFGAGSFFTQGTGCGEISGKTRINDGQWHHIAATFDKATGEQYIYTDGVLENSSQGTVGVPMNLLSTEDLVIGAHGESCSFHGLIDEVRIYNKALSHFEIKSLARDDYYVAWDPDPTGMVEWTPAGPTLSWLPGDYAQDVNGHYVYFGTDYDDVKDGNSSVEMGFDVVAGPDANDRFSYAVGELEVDTTYYWRVDEVNSSMGLTWPGNIWSFTTDSGTAWNVSPADGAEDVDVETELLWRGRDYAAWHDVYFGTDQDAVAEANDSLTPGPDSVYRGRQGPADTNYSPPEILEFGTIHFWRIDEVNDAGMAQWPGKVWHFTTRDHILVDDFDSYTGNGTEPYEQGDLWYTWIDWHGAGNDSGAAIFLETDPNFIHGSEGKSMKYMYGNDGQPGGTEYYSEIEREYDTPQDWTRAGLKTLVLYFYGQSGNDVNDTEQMYVALEDNAGHTAVVPYDTNAVATYNGDASDLQKEEWQQWNIKLADFNESGVDLSSIKKLYIGFGDRDSHSQPGGEGMVYFDDIRLYPTRCVLDYGGVADFTDDCLINFNDFALLARHWLEKIDPNCDLTTDSLEITMNNGTGRITDILLDGTSVVDPEVSGGFSYRAGSSGDFTLLNGTVVDGVLSATDGFISLTATFEDTSEMIRIDGTVEKPGAGIDLGIQLRFQLPVDATGWTFWEDPRRPQEINSTSTRYAFEQFIRWQQLQKAAIYPLIAVSPETFTSGVSMAVPLDVPNVYRLAYKDGDGLYIDFDLGLHSAQDGGPHSDFSIVIYPHRADWGMRSALQGYYDRFPQFFIKRVPPEREGVWFFAMNKEAIGDTNDFNLAFDEHAGSRWVWSAERGIYTMEYSEPWRHSDVWYPKGDPGPHPEPNYAEMLAHLKEHLNSPSPYYKEGAEAALISGMRNYDGTLKTDLSYWDRNGYWNVRWHTILHNDLAGGQQDWMMTYRYQSWLDSSINAGAPLQGWYLDSVNLSGRTEDYNTVHFALPDMRLTFSYEHDCAMLLGWLADYDFVDWFSNKLHSEDRILFGNGVCWGIRAGVYFYPHLFDAIGIERSLKGYTGGGAEPEGPPGPTDSCDKGILVGRALMYRKPICTLYEHQRDTYEFNWRHSVFYGIHDGPHDAWFSPTMIEELRPVSKKYVPIIKELVKAGWNPVTYARADGLWLERFGGEDAGPMYITVRNWQSEPVESTIEIQLRGPGWSGTISEAALEMVANDIVPVTIEADKAYITTSVESEDTKVYKVSFNKHYADFNEDGSVDLKEFGTLVEHWLETGLWP